jgi:hypothetical protein
VVTSAVPSGGPANQRFMTVAPDVADVVLARIVHLKLYITYHHYIFIVDYTAPTCFTVFL